MTKGIIGRMAVPQLNMQAKMAAFLMILFLNVVATFQAEPEIIGVVVDDPEEMAMKGNNTTEESDWSQVVNELAIALERVDREQSLENDSDGEEEEEGSGKSRIIKRQVIKIPSSVTKVKVIAPNPLPKTRPKRMPPIPRLPPYAHHQRKRPPRRPSHSRPVKDLEEDYEEPKHHRNRDTDGRRGKYSKKSKPVVKEVSPEEFYDDDDHQYGSSSKVDSYQRQVKKSHARKPQRHVHYGSFEDPSDPPHQRRIRRPPLDDYDTPSRDRNTDGDYSRPARPYSDKRPVPSYSSSEYSHDRDYEDYAASTIHMKQVPAPNLTGLNLIEPPDLLKEAATSSLRTTKESSVADYTAKAAPSSKDIASAFPQQYTSHNPQVVTNFGLDDQTKSITYAMPKLEYSGFEDKSYRGLLGPTTRYNQLNTAASEHHVTTVPSGGNGLKVVQPPQLGIGSVQGTGAESSETPRGNQRATIRDILQQDCPDYEMLGYCSSPPRYPTIQIADMASKCSDLQDVMTSPVPAEPQDDLASFSRRSDDYLDIIFDHDKNDTDIFPRSWPSWSRSGSESETACASEYTIIEPGYAREVTSGRWFVIVQNSDSSLQKVTTDTCLNPGKPCGGLAGMKCSRNRGFHNGIKSTRCIQRYTHQRLISWDPESPSKCPRIRVFRFPTACICHLRLM